MILGFSYVFFIAPRSPIGPFVLVARPARQHQTAEAPQPRPRLRAGIQKKTLSNGCGNLGKEADPEDIGYLRDMMRKEGQDPDDIPELEDMPKGGVVTHYASVFFVGPVGIVMRGGNPLPFVQYYRKSEYTL